MQFSSWGVHHSWSKVQQSQHYKPSTTNPLLYFPSQSTSPTSTSLLIQKDSERGTKSVRNTLVTKQMNLEAFRASIPLPRLHTPLIFIIILCGGFFFLYFDFLILEHELSVGAATKEIHKTGEYIYNLFNLNQDNIKKIQNRPCWT